ncbi:MAG: nuclear transport factor 2 family protein [Deltaproteobacteria bacterium]|nr:nuclear transport factor 2 family protein [Deltaproteobacteria bacterium]MBI3388494.1 nuclear transport factor 2 family protein [Deltaproteobacteria bacterium]
MNCASCDHANPEAARFCNACGAALAARCPSCAADNPPGSRFCNGCGAALVGSRQTAVGSSPLPLTPNPISEARKVVTIIFADLVGSTSLHERLDAESVRRLMDRYYRALRGAIEAHGGTVVKLLGDGVMAAFGVPRVAEDDAIRAVRAGVAIVEAVKGLGDQPLSPSPNPQALTPNPLSVRVGINTGEVVVSADNTDVVGDPANVAARLQQEARAGEVIIGEATRRLVSELVTLAPAGVFALKGRTETMAAYRVLSLERPAAAAAIAFVGRDDELRRVLAVYDAAVAERRARLAVVLGSPGLGKSRLIEELARRLGDGATVLTAQCESAGGATFAPIAKALRANLSDPSDRSDRSDAAIAAALPASDDRARIADGIAALLAGTPGSPEETFFVVRRFLAGLTTTRPVVLAIDDLQWAEPLLLDLVEHLVQWGKEMPLLVLAGARPELRDARSSLTATGGLVSDVITLGGLDAAAATRLAANVIGADALPAAVAGRVLATSEGNPLFLAELVRMLVTDGALKQDGDHWTAAVDLAALDMPPTIHALLAARIERLRPEDRAVLERAAVVGRQFSRSAVAHLLPREVSDLDARLESLRRSEVIESDTGWFLGEPALRFHHGLIRDAAYRRVLKGTRAELHARLADWIETKVGESIEHDETLGWHFEQAHQHLRELGPIAAHGRALGERAARYLAAAGRRALARDDLSPAANLLGRALDRLDESDSARADLALDWCEALLSAGDVGPATKAIAELARFVEDKGLGGYGAKGLRAKSDSSVTPNPLTPNPQRLRAWHTCFVGQLAVLTDPQALQATADAVAAAADAMVSVGDAAGEAKAHSVHALALQRLGKVGACEAALDKALAAARRANDRRRSNAVLAGAPLAALWGPSPVTRASGRCLDVVRVLRITQGAPAVEAVALRCQAVLEALRGRTEAARRMIVSSRKMVEELGITQRVLEADVFAGLIDLLEGDAVAAESCLRGAYDGLRTHGLGIDAARAAAFLGRALLAQGRAAEAEALSHESELLGGDDLQAAITWRGVRAEALAQRGEHAAAIDFARAAVDIAAATDALLHHANARSALAVALRAAGRADEANAEEAHAIELWEAKGATLLVERAHGAAPRIDATVARSDAREGEPPGEPSDGRSGSAKASPSQTGKSRWPGRRVRPNAATAWRARFDAALAARDFDAVAAEMHEEWREIDHPTGSDYGRDAGIASLQRLFRSRASYYKVESLATLGERLLLTRRRTGASGDTRGRYDVGPYESEAIEVTEVDAHGLVCRQEVFAADNLGDAIVRLYERYAELLPDGPERERAAATARTVAIFVSGALDIDRCATAVAPGVEYVDHRPIGLESAYGAESVLRVLRSLLEVAGDSVVCVDDIIALRSDALLMRWTHFGTERVGGGRFERNLCQLFVFDADGLLARWEQFAVDREDEALARVDELVLMREGEASAEPFDARGGSAEALPSHSPRPSGTHRRVRPNAATAWKARFDAALAARDLGAVAAAMHEEFQEIYHPTGSTYGGDAGIASLQRLFRSSAPYYKVESLATLGERLLLTRRRTGASGDTRGRYDVGPYESEAIEVTEVDARGLVCRQEIFAADRLGDAVSRLYERYAELFPEDRERVRAAAAARTLGSVLQPANLDAWCDTVADEFELIDHRVLGIGTLHGGEAMRANFRAMFELEERFQVAIHDVLALRPDAILFLGGNVGVIRASGGVYERIFLQLLSMRDDGRFDSFEYFDAGCEAEALARFDALVGITREDEPSGEPWVERSGSAEASPSQDERFENAASRADRKLFDVFNARDWAGVEALAAPELVFDERRRMLHNTCGREIWLEQFRVLFDVPKSRFTTKLRATRGERLALSLHSFEGEVAHGGGPLAVDDHLVLHEVDGDGRIVAIVLFDEDAADAAYAELDARFDAGEGAAHARNLAAWRGRERAMAIRDWDALSASRSPDFVFRDHRLLGWGTTMSDSTSADQITKALVDLAPDVRRRHDHVRLCERGILEQMAQVGTRDGGAFENVFLAVYECDAQGRWQTVDNYDVEQINQARARFAELNPSVSPHGKGRIKEGSWPARFANAATRVVERGVAALEARDWEGFGALFAAGFRHDDRTRMVQLETDGRTWLASFRQMAEMTSWNRARILATRGERLALFRILWRGAEGDVGPSEIEWLVIIEVDDRGDHSAVVTFDPDDLAAAYAELDACWAAGEATAHPLASKWLADYLRAFAARDWNTWCALCASDIVGYNHRLVGWGTLHGPAAMVSTMQAQIELAPDTQERVDHVRTGAHAVLFEYAWHGTREGGAFENLWIVLIELDAAGLARRADVWEAEQLDEARVRFAAIGGRARWEGEAPAEPVRVAGSGSAGASPSQTAQHLAVIAKPNAASEWLHRFQLAFNTRDWDALRALYASQVVYEDRQRLSQLSGGFDMMMSSVRERAEAGARQERIQLLGTAGSRVAIQRLLWAGGGTDHRFEMEHLVVQEIDEVGRLVATINFDLDDARAAQREAWARWAAIEPDLAATVGLISKLMDAFDAHDPAVFRTLCTDDLVYEDHRRTGIGRLDGSEAFVESLVALWNLAPLTRIEAGFWPACDRHGAVAVLRRSGTLPDGGDFESEYLELFVQARGRATHLELFEIDDLDAALAHFEELRPDPLHVPPNAATRAIDRQIALASAGDWEAVRALHAPGLVFDDRRRGLRSTTDAEGYLASIRWAGPNTERASTVLATAGDRLALQRNRFTRTKEVLLFEIETLALTELDAEGRLVAVVLFDPDDRAAASAELIERYAAIGADDVPAAWFEFVRAWNDHDLVRLRTLLPSDYFFHDHRRTGIGQVHGEAYIASLDALYELSPDVKLEPLHWVVVADHGGVGVMRWVGTDAQGGEFEAVFIGLSVRRGDQIVGAELFEIDDLDSALARFEELRTKG